MKSEEVITYFCATCCKKTTNDGGVCDECANATDHGGFIIICPRCKSTNKKNEHKIDILSSPYEEDEILCDHCNYSYSSLFGARVFDRRTEPDFSHIHPVSEHHGYEITPREYAILEDISNKISIIAESPTISDYLKIGLQIATANIYAALLVTQRYKPPTDKPIELWTCICNYDNHGPICTKCGRLREDQ